MNATLADCKIAIVHIGKTGGTSIRLALRPFFTEEEVCPLQFEGQYPDDLSELTQYRLFDSHISYEIASRLDAELITVMRNPFDRLISLYSYWREVPQDTMGPGWAKRLDLERFFERARDIPEIALEAFNGQTWQLAFGTNNAQRKSHADLSDDEILSRALSNLEDFKAVGVTEAMPAFFKMLNDELSPTHPIEPKRVNVTAKRMAMSEVPMHIRKKMSALIDLDIALYDAVLKRYVL